MDRYKLSVIILYVTGPADSLMGINLIECGLFYWIEFFHRL